MATVKSTSITNLDAGTINPAGLEEGRIFVARETITSGTSDATGSDYRFFKVHSSWSFVACQLVHGDGGDTNSNIDLGLYNRGSTAVDINCFISNQDFSSATDSGLVLAPLTGTARTVQNFWELTVAGSDPDVWYDVCATLNTAASDAAVTVYCQMWYTTEANS